MKVALLNPTILLRRPIVELARELTERGHDVEILTSVDPTVQPIKGHFEGSSARIVPLPSKEIRRYLWPVPRWETWRRLWIIMDEVDVLHIWAPYYLVSILPLIFRVTRKPRCQIILTFDTLPGYSFQFNSIFDVLMRLYHTMIGSWLFRRADGVTLYAESLRVFARQAHLPTAVTVIPTGIRLPPPQEPRASVSAPFRILFVGLLNTRKGVGILLQALAQLQKENISFQATLVGDGPEREKFETLARMLGITDDTSFIGRSSDVASYYRQADVFVLPSLGEGLPGVVMEAMSYGLPVITSNIPCLDSLVKSGEDGLLVPKNDPAALARAIRWCVEHPDACLALGRSGAQSIRRFSWSEITPRYETFYESLTPQTI